jgi:hypothetical protein
MSGSAGSAATRRVINPQHTSHRFVLVCTGRKAHSDHVRLRRSGVVATVESSPSGLELVNVWDGIPRAAVPAWSPVIRASRAGDVAPAPQVAQVA